MTRLVDGNFLALEGKVYYMLLRYSMALECFGIKPIYPGADAYSPNAAQSVIFNSVTQFYLRIENDDS